MNELTPQIIHWITEQTNHQIKEDTQLLKDGILDSMLILTFVGWLEQTFSITIGVEQMTPDFFSSPRNIADQIARLKT